MEPVIQIKNLSKKYNITHQQGGYITLRDIITDVAKHPIKFLKNKTKKIIGKETMEEFWALKKVDFSIEKGEAIGIIGSNGAGKSTLLKILSKITPPTTGEIKYTGNMSSLLEVGTGFHPELTGRENIFLNGAILGMKKKEIAKKFDAIVEFAGISKFIDTPVKRYSSGMYVRLAFAVAAHMEPDILIVDEVLAVGDAEFQKKCLGKMDEVTKEAGRTIIFVSHNMEAVEKLCNRCILLEKGGVKKIGPTKEVINEYIKNKPLQKNTSENILHLDEGGFTGKINFTDVVISDKEESPLIKSDSALKIKLKYKSNFKQDLSDIRFLISIISERSGQMVLRLDSHVVSKTLDHFIKSSGEIICETDKINLAEGTYNVEILVLPQKRVRSKLKIMSNFNVTTDLTKYDYKLSPDNTVCDHLIKYSFSNN
ncbi:MAG: ABC transporter ATP-binding protein [Candidatus Pacebacteria bacterium]|nr:ABC transporter ATP-binding protein [Candidatus Paceibacterota bacterium]